MRSIKINVENKSIVANKKRREKYSSIVDYNVL